MGGSGRSSGTSGVVLEALMALRQILDVNVSNTMVFVFCAKTHQQISHCAPRRCAGLS